MSYHNGNQFFKVLYDPSSSVLAIPPTMNKFFSINKLNNKVLTVTTVTCKSWSVRVQLIEDILAFTDGWSNVVKDLDFGTFVVIFSYIAHKTFLIKYYNHSPYLQVGNSFFKIIENELTTPPVIPSSFVNNNFAIELPSIPVVLYVSDEFQWNVQIHTIGSNVCFTDGWLKFMSDLRLTVGDAICFDLMDNLTFKVTTFSKSGRQMKVFKILSTDNNEEHNKSPYEMSNFHYYPAIPGFSCNVTNELVIPNNIAELIGVNKNMNLKIKFINGNLWNAPINIEVVDGIPRFNVIGWRNFIDAEGISIGQLYLFKWSAIHRKLFVSKYQQQEVMDITMN